LGAPLLSGLMAIFPWICWLRQSSSSPSRGISPRAWVPLGAALGVAVSSDNWTAIAGVTSAIAAAAAVAAVKFDLARKRSDRAERTREQRERKEADDRRQADRVAAWVDVRVMYEDAQHGLDPCGGSG
jgi:hypothetical protein